MRLLAIAPLVLCTVALILSFLCLFAGSKKNFMEDYAVLTLNTSRIGEDIDLFGIDLRRRDDTPVPNAVRDVGGIFASATKDIHSLATAAATKASAAAKATDCNGKKDGKDDGLVGWAESELHHAECKIENKLDSFKNWVEEEIDTGINDLAQVLGIHDFYSAHIMDFCEGYYVPGPVPNATVKPGTIRKNVTSCSNHTSNYHFDPTSTLSKELNESTDGLVDLSKLHWPQEVHDGLNALKVAQKAVFVLYCIAIAFIFLATIVAAASIFSSRKLIAVINVAADGAAFLAIMLASAIVTFIADHATHLINKYGEDISVRANKGNKFLALTWATTALVGLACIIWIVDFFLGFKADHTRRKYENEPKYG